MDADGLEARFERRAARARLLAETPSPGQGPLRFAAGLFPVQARAATAVLAVHRRQPLSGDFAADGPRVAEALRAVLAYLSDTFSPSPRNDGERVGVRGLLHQPPRGPGSMGSAQTEAAPVQPWLADAWSGTPDFAARAALRAYAEALVCDGVPLTRPRPPGTGHCPRCGEAPSLSFRRTAPGTDGAARWLACALCGSEWQANRICCPLCGETDPVKLPGWQAEQYPAVRIEACESCHRYLKSVDLSVDGTAVPEVDELRSLGLDLWAQEKGYARSAPGLAGL